jgi:hypothetical protein
MTDAELHRETEESPMHRRTKWIVALVAVIAGVAVGAALLGRSTADTRAARDSGYRTGHQDGYFDGLSAGEAQGRREGRALQEGDALPADARRPVKDAFDAGYAAGANDAFAGWDGGWQLSAPYVITVVAAGGAITYRIKDREPVKAGVNYFLCPDGHSLCQERRG